ncbi:4-aminobutyrate aminotransferase [Weissella oryzae SG25]|uniref:4-aminobutyrate aminotransferase n=1 Tax=Weissella oryzae (strain DSM 25784 / JCM 18191 / LMG 30913 / SG25) TaxID=1329250 RepID=A0A069CYB1_WEIOS|nr:aspartate aminotransferase family protein [Weissella oryzae]GAK30091.1 4-aminobutyrate aminotransferase [Weissella oryzae SG25]
MQSNNQVLAAEADCLPTSSRIKYFDMVLDHGQGAILVDVEGHEYIDLLASASSANTGHAHPKVVQAIQQQAAKLIHFTPAYYANEVTASLLNRLAALAPGDFPKKVAFGTSGSDANDAMIKYSRAYTGRHYIISFTGAYHGSTYGAISLSGVSLNMARKIGPLLPDIIKMPFPDPHLKLAGESEAAFVDRMWQMFMLPFENWLPVEEVAGILIEPIQGDGGLVATPHAYMDKLYQFTRAHNIVFAVDEINQGFGRSGKMWSIDHYQIAPDLMSIGKSLASGMPISALIGRKEILDSLDAPAHLFTTSGNPVCAAAAHATLDVIEAEHLVERSAKLGQMASTFFTRMQQKFSFVGAVRMFGLNGGIDIVDQDGQADVDATTEIIYHLFKAGVIMISLRGNILRFQPPLVISETQLETAFQRIEAVFEAKAKNQLTLPNDADAIGW